MTLLPSVFIKLLVMIFTIISYYEPMMKISDTISLVCFLKVADRWGHSPSVTISSGR